MNINTRIFQVSANALSDDLGLRLGNIVGIGDIKIVSVPKPFTGPFSGHGGEALINVLV